MLDPGRIEFELQFDPAEIPRWAKKYDVAGDDDALDAGRRIASGTFDPISEFAIIFRWKTRNRGRSRLFKNTPEEIADALTLAVLAKTERSAVAVLRGLSGVGTPVASAILTAINPERYTVIDFRALEALGADTVDRSLPFYLYYLRYCREIAGEYGVSLRKLDRALWQWSYERATSATL